MANISFFDSIRYSDGIKEYRSNLSKYMLEPSVDNYSKLKNVQERSGLSIDICNTLISEEIQKPLDDILNKEKISKVELDYILKLTSTLNWNLSNQSSETLVFSRKIGILILVPYVFSLVFALMSRNKGNFLFRLPRPLYQAVLRKFVSLPS